MTPGAVKVKNTNIYWPDMSIINKHVNLVCMVL